MMLNGLLLSDGLPTPGAAGRHAWHLPVEPLVPLHRHPDHGPVPAVRAEPPGRAGAHLGEGAAVNQSAGAGTQASLSNPDTP